MLTDLTQEQEALLDTIAKEAEDAVFACGDLPPKEAIQKALTLAYSAYDMKVPERVETVDSPEDALALAENLTGQKEAELDSFGVADSGWVAWSYAYYRLGLQTDEEFEDTRTIQAFHVGVWDTILLDECAILVRMPEMICRDAEGNLHSASGPAIRWRNGQCAWAWHGVWVPEKVISAPRSFTKEEFLAITDTEVRRALGEIAGWAWVMEILGAKCVDSWTDEKTLLAYELWGSERGEKWIRKQSPKLKNGSQPWYVEPVHEDLRTAKAARKWQACRLSVDECEKDPELVYEIET